MPVATDRAGGTEALEEPPRGDAARCAFNSHLELEVCLQKRPGIHDTITTVGTTPAAEPLTIPACHRWWVEPKGADLRAVAREVRAKDISGLFLRHEYGDAELAHLGELADLEFFALEGPRITDKGFRNLAKLTKARALYLIDSHLTNVTLAYLRTLTRLDTLALIDARSVDTDYTHLAKLTGLRTLILYRSRISGAGLAHLGGLTKLRMLDLGETRITDAGLEHLTKLTELQTLSLRSTSVTDAGLAHLKGLTRLQNLDLAGTRATDAAVTDLRLALPNLKVVR